MLMYGYWWEKIDFGHLWDLWDLCKRVKLNSDCSIFCSKGDDS